MIQDREEPAGVPWRAWRGRRNGRLSRPLDIRKLDLVVGARRMVDDGRERRWVLVVAGRGASDEGRGNGDSTVRE